jgi:hypothetical protein
VKTEFACTFYRRIPQLSQYKVIESADLPTGGTVEITIEPLGNYALDHIDRATPDHIGNCEAKPARPMVAILGDSYYRQ